MWTVTTKPFREAHFATFPEDLIEPCVLACSLINGVVLDLFFGSKHGSNFLRIELNPVYIKIAEKRLSELQLELIYEM